jgi:eukaryotic-like serine/threonine-protein kinase
VDATVKNKIGKYEITGILGRGGMGVVYRAEDRRIGRQVAIKTLTEGFSGQPDMLERFYREAQAGILQHPNIVIVYDLGDEDGVPFIVMEFVDGEPLDKLIASGKQLNLIDKLSIIEQVCSALGYAHQRGVIHRDIKPANVIVQPDGHAKIVDFGIARVQKSKEETGLTRTGNVIGTIHYIAPERLKGLAFDGRSDIFSTGVMLYLLLAGELPFTGEDVTVLHKLVSDPAPPLSTYLSSYPPALDGILDRALAKDPAQRYATAEEFAADLHALGEQLKKGQVAELFNDAERLAAQDQFGRAREVLLQLVRIEPQHTGARQLLSVVQQNLARLQRAEQVRQLVAEAEEALASARYAAAMGSLDQAVQIDPDNDDLKRRLENARKQKQCADEIAALMTQAESFRERGDWTGAIQVAEKALKLDENNAAIRSTVAELTRQAKLAAQQHQVRELLGKAREEYTARRFTQAVEILREVGKIDPTVPELDSLIAEAVSGQEQERRRQLIGQIQSEIENCINAEDYDRASELIDRALEKLPTESSLLQLRSRVALQLREHRARQLIESTVGKAQEALLESPGEALLIVQKALQELPGQERLLALEHSIRQRLKAAEKEEIRAQYLREAQQAIDRSEFEKAVEVLESYRLEFADAAGVGELLEFARKELAAQQQRARIAASVSRARALMDQQQFGEAVVLLESAVAETGDPSLDRLLADARAQRQEAERKIEAQLARITRLRERGQLQEAIELLQALPAASISGNPLNTLLNEIRAEQARRQATESALADAAAATDREGFLAAIESLQAVQSAWGESPAITKAIADIESKRSQLSSANVSKAVETARAALLSNNAAAALEQLRAVAEWVEFAGATQQSDWRRLGAEASKPAARRSTGDVPQIGFGPAEPEAAPRKSKLLIPLIAGVAVAVIAAVVLVMHFTAHKPAVQSQAPVQQVPATPAPAAAPPTGTLAVDGSQDNVQIFVDGLLKGFTQKDGSLNVPLDPGTHSIRLTKAGYSDFTPSAITIAANQQTTLHYNLTKSASAAPPPPPSQGFLSLHSTPGAQVSIDHVPAGTTDARGNLILPVKPGARSLQIALNGYQPFTQDFNIRAGEQNNLAVVLTPAPAPIPAAPAVQPVQILSFSATASQIEQGQSTTLQWNTANAGEVLINNGIARVDSSGQTTVRPQRSTTYVLTASGNGGTQQRSVNIIVEPKPTVASAPTPAAPAPPGDSALVRAALENFSAALSFHNVSAMKAIWPTMTSSQEKLFRSFFKNNRNARISDSCDPSSLTISGSSASWACIETTTIMAGGSPVKSEHGIRFTFRKNGGDWIIADRH